MRGDHLEKTFLQERILPLLFNRKSATIFRSARNAPESHDTRVKDLQEQYDSTNKTDGDFWESVADIISDAYDVSFSDFSEVEFEEFVRELLDARFDKEFRVNDIRKLDVGTAIDDFLSEVDEGDNIVLNSDDSDPRTNKQTDFSFHFISVEAISNLYDIFSENTNIISSNSEAYGEILSHVQSMINESQFSEDCEDLSENEEEYIDKIRRTIDDSDYMPEDRYRYFWL